MQFHIQPFTPNRADLSGIQTEARAAGFRFVDRFVSKFETGENRFDAPGEKLLGAFCDDELIGFGGLNRDPYETAEVGRIRHLYVLEKHRRMGVAKALVLELLNDCHFQTVQLRTPNVSADRFYESIGFARIDGENASHRMEL